jgi:hypothetical protein
VKHERHRAGDRTGDRERPISFADPEVGPCARLTFVHPRMVTRVAVARNQGHGALNRERAPGECHDLATSLGWNASAPTPLSYLQTLLR